MTNWMATLVEEGFKVCDMAELIAPGIIEYCVYPDDPKTLSLAYLPKEYFWRELKFIRVEDSYYYFDEAFRSDGSFLAYDIRGRLTPFSNGAIIHHASLEEVVNICNVYFLNLNADDPWPLGRADGSFWDGERWCTSTDGGYWSDEDDFIIIPFPEVKSVLRSFGATND